MTKSAIVVVIGMCLLVPTIASADSVLYTLSTDYSGINGLPALPFPAPSPFTSEVITDFTGLCFGGITSVDTFFNGDLSSAGNVHTARASTGQIIGTLAISSVPEPTQAI